VVPTATPFTVDGYQAEYKTTVDQFKTFGVSEAVLRDVYRNTILRDKLTEAIAADQPPSEEQVWARHILVDSAAQAVAISQLLRNGSDFA